jgi:Baseplate J-like protein
MSTSESACPCETAQDPRVVTNQPGLSTIAYRVDDFSGFRRALQRPLDGEVALAGWHPAPGDLGLQVLEWWAYLADILTFYNERIANEDYLRTAELPTSVTGLVALLGYQPRPAIAATGQLAAIRSNARPTEPVVIPAGLQFSNTATPGVPVETFEAQAATFTGLSDVAIGLEPGTALLHPLSNGALQVGSVLLAGAVSGINPGDELLAVERNWSTTTHYWAKLTVDSTSVETDPNNGKKNTRVVLDAPQLSEVENWMRNAAASGFRLLKSRQTAALWTQGGSTTPISNSGDTELTLNLSAVVRGISAGDFVFLDGSNQGAPATAVGLVLEISETYSTIAYPGNVTPKPADIPIAHTTLTMLSPYAEWVVEHMTDVKNIVVRHGMKDVGTLIGAPTTTLTSLPATVIPPAGFTLPAGGLAAFVEDPTKLGIPVQANTNSDGTIKLTAVDATPPAYSLAAPLRLDVDLVNVSRGKTVAAEVLGTGDASVAGQIFALKQSPLTYLAKGATYASTLAIAVDELYWTQASTFYAQPPNATIYVVSQLPDGSSVVRFGDGVNGARLPTGSTVVATYRYGAGAASPPAGRLTTILKPQPNLASVHNPVAVWGGADAQSPADVRQNAPSSVLTFGRAISADDYVTVAALAPGVTRASATWSWDEAHQRALVKVYVGDDAGAAASAQAALAGAEDPNRPVKVVQATAVPLVVSGTLLVSPAYVLADVGAAAVASLDALFGPQTMAIGQPLYASQVESALLVPGAVALHGLSVTADGVDVFASEPVGWVVPGECSYYALDSSAITPVPANA